MSKKKIPPLIIDRVMDESNLCFLSLVEYRRMEYIGIIDNITDTHVKIFALDFIRPNTIPRTLLLSTAIRWFYEYSDRKPLSIILSQMGLTHASSPLYKSFELNGISRIVGNPFSYRHFTEQKTKKKKVLSIPEGITVTFKK
jgi:hypothetical protein